MKDAPPLLPLTDSSARRSNPPEADRKPVHQRGGGTSCQCLRPLQRTNRMSRPLEMHQHIDLLHVTRSR